MLKRRRRFIQYPWDLETFPRKLATSSRPLSVNRVLFLTRNDARLFFFLRRSRRSGGGADGVGVQVGRLLGQVRLRLPAQRRHHRRHLQRRLQTAASRRRKVSVTLFESLRMCFFFQVDGRKERTLGPGLMMCVSTVSMAGRSSTWSATAASSTGRWSTTRRPRTWRRRWNCWPIFDRTCATTWSRPARPSRRATATSSSGCPTCASGSARRAPSSCISPTEPSRSFFFLLIVSCVT